MAIAANVVQLPGTAYQANRNNNEIRDLLVVKFCVRHWCVKA